MKVTQRFVFMVAVLLLVAGSAFGQGTTGSLNGTVTHEGAPLPGVTITISSPNLQGTRVGVSNVNGDYNFPAMPPGDYTVKFEMEGMATVTKTVTVGLAQTGARQRGDAALGGRRGDHGHRGGAGGPRDDRSAGELRLGDWSRTCRSAVRSRTTVSLAPGVTANGRADAIVVGGAYAYDTLYLVNGAVTNENVRGQTENLFIEDAIQETSVIAGSVSAEYGRFTGGVVSAITKSGGNEFSGSFRDSFTNPAWDRRRRTTARRSRTASPTRRTKRRSAAASSATVSGSSRAGARRRDDRLRRSTTVARHRHPTARSGESRPTSATRSSSPARSPRSTASSVRTSSYDVDQTPLLRVRLLGASAIDLNGRQTAARR